VIYEVMFQMKWMPKDCATFRVTCKPKFWDIFNECVTAAFSLKSTRAVLEQWWCLTPIIIGKYNFRYKFGTREQKGLPFLP